MLELVAVVRGQDRRNLLIALEEMIRVVSSGDNFNSDEDEEGNSSYDFNIEEKENIEEKK